MKIKQIVHKRAEFYTPRRPCRKCGESKRYLSTRHCVACKRVYDLAREGDRRSVRAKAIDKLLRQKSIPMRRFPKAFQDAFIRAYYPNWEVRREENEHTTTST